MVSIIAVATPVMASGSISIAIFKELPSLPDYIPFLQFSPVISLIIKIPDDPEVDKLIFEVIEETVFASRVPLQASSSYVSHPLYS